MAVVCLSGIGSGSSRYLDVVAPSVNWRSGAGGNRRQFHALLLMVWARILTLQRRFVQSILMPDESKPFRRAPSPVAAWLHVGPAAGTTPGLQCNDLMRLGLPSPRLRLC